MTDPVTELATRAAMEAAYIMLREAFARIKGQLQKVKPRRRASLVKDWGGRLDDLAIDLASCFDYDPPNPTLYSVLFDFGHQDDAWRIIHASINVTDVWFKSWNAMRATIGNSRNAEILILQIEELGSILFFASMAGAEMRKIEAALQPENRAREPFKVAADRFNACLTSYESLLRRLPNELELDYLSEHRADRVRLDDFPPRGFDRDDLRPATARDLRQQLAEPARNPNSDGISGLNEATQSRLQARARGARHRKRPYVLCAEDKPAKFLDFFHDLCERWIELPENRETERSQYARIGIRRAGAKQQPGRRI